MSWEFLDGIRLNGRYFSNEQLTLGFDISFGTMGIGMGSTAPKTDAFSDATNSYTFRFSPPDRSIIYDTFIKKDKVVKLELVGSFEKDESIFAFLNSFGKSINLYDVLKKLDDFKLRTDVRELYINITKFSANYSDMWEIREKLSELKKAGKRITIYSENYDIRSYHFASIADQIVIEPMGIMTLEGFAMGRSYYKTFMDKYGIGYDEIRLFKYKSAAESMSRTNFSEGEREQRLELISDFYDIAKSDITLARSISADNFDNIVNNELFIDYDKAKSLKLIDNSFRWNIIDTLIKANNDKYEIIEEGWISPDFTAYDNRWSKQSRRIALVNAEGVCDMESGIKGRALSQIMENVLQNDEYEAVILRVNSPGGSALASDYVAEVIRRFKGKKPILVSQGFVAASGGYWLSMDADTILATPVTITGSIGVISSWIYNKGIMDSLGVSYDLVKRGEHSDLGMPINLPFIPIGLPARKMTNIEMDSYKSMILNFYGDFVRKVATGRKQDSARIGEIAQGRVYTGKTGKSKGLVDEIGGIWRAIEIAKDKINVKRNETIEVVKLEPRGANILEQLMLPFQVFSKSKTNALSIFPNLQDDLKFRLDNNGKMQHILPIDYYDLLR